MCLTVSLKPQTCQYTSGSTGGDWSECVGSGPILADTPAVCEGPSLSAAFRCFFSAVPNCASSQLNLRRGGTSLGLMCRWTHPLSTGFWVPKRVFSKPVKAFGDRWRTQCSRVAKSSSVSATTPQAAHALQRGLGISLMVLFKTCWSRKNGFYWTKKDGVGSDIGVYICRRRVAKASDHQSPRWTGIGWWPTCRES